MAYLGKNDVLEAVTEPKLLKGLVRVLWVDKRSDQIVLMTIERSPKRPWVMQLSELKSWLSSGDIKFLSVTPPTYMLKTEEDLSDKEKAFRDNSWARIQSLVDTDPPDAIFQPDALGRMVAAQAVKLGLPNKSVYRLLYRYWMAGQVRNSLLPDRVNAGGPGKPKNYPNGLKPGRSTMFQGVKSSTQSKVLSDTDKNCIKTGFALFAKGSVGSLFDIAVYCAIVPPATLTLDLQKVRPSPMGAGGQSSTKAVAAHDGGVRQARLLSTGCQDGINATLV